MNDQRIRTGAILTAALMLFGLAGCGNFRERANQQDEVSAETRQPVNGADLCVIKRNDTYRIISECERRGMKVWILDDDHFPTGHAAGAVKDHPDLRPWQLLERHVDVMGPADNAMLITEPTGKDHILLGVFAYKRTGEGEACEPEAICLTDGIDRGFLRFSVPAGCYRVFFLYKSRRGTSHPDYVDMLRKQSVKLLIDTVYESHYEHYGRHFGKTIAGFFSDEPSFGNTWAGQHSMDHGMYDRRVGMPGLALPYSDLVPGMMTQALGVDALPLLPRSYNRGYERPRTSRLQCRTLFPVARRSAHERY